MKIGNFLKGACEDVGGRACAVLVPVEMTFDIIGTDIECPHYEYDERQMR